MHTLLESLKAAAEPTRLRILALVNHCDLTVTELSQILGQSQPRVSRHLKLLTAAGLIDRYQEGTWAFYRASDQGFRGEMGQSLVSWIPGDDPVVSADSRRLDAIRGARRREAADYFRRVAEDWDRVRGRRIDETQVEQAILNLARDKFGGDLLDLGTGTGRMLEIFSGSMRHGIGIDQSHNMLNVARSKLDEAGIRNCQVRLGDIYNLPVPDGCTDLVTMHQVLHYLDDPAAAIAEAVRALRPHGLLVVVDFAPHGIEFLRTEYSHRRLGFNETEVKDWCKQAGLKGVEASHLLPDNGNGDDKLAVTIWVGRQGADAPAHYVLEVA